ncbi:protein RDM1-like [Populus alba x Populus x berolinensis]|uniref:Protein RDM1-like n=1 Tax=Populus alba x Populus x berolinensis TaxID=444605 RepID=A0AAD6MMN8_9ROSI|nr:protein RDM1-like [Populus alba x Populus x berolinensis]
MMLRPHAPLRSNHLCLSDSETESDDLDEHILNVQDRKKNSTGVYDGKENCMYKKNKEIDTVNEDHMKSLMDESDITMRKAEIYQEYMKQIPVPSSTCGLPVSYMTWQELARTIKQVYGQPLHYLTNKLLKQWDQLRIGTKDESKPLDNIIDPIKAVATVWGMEEFHRQCSSHQHLAKLWLSDPLQHDSLDKTVPH